MPTLTLTLDTLAALGVSRDDLLQPVLSSDATRLLEPLLASRGFDISRAVQVIERAATGCVKRADGRRRETRTAALSVVAGNR